LFKEMMNYRTPESWDEYEKVVASLSEDPSYGKLPQAIRDEIQHDLSKDVADHVLDNAMSKVLPVKPKRTPKKRKAAGEPTFVEG
jgi:hypothetical protein